MDRIRKEKINRGMKGGKEGVMEECSTGSSVAMESKEVGKERQRQERMHVERDRGKEERE